MAVVAVVPRRRVRPVYWRGRRIHWSGYLFVLPFFVPFLLFTAGAIIFGAVVAFTDWRVVGEVSFLGTANFREAFSDDLARRAFLNTLRYGLVIVPGVTVFGFLAALYVNERWYGYTFARIAFYAPNVMSGTVIGLLWVWIFDTNFGVLNNYLGRVGIDNLPWLTSTNLAWVAISIASIWWDLGLAFVLFLAGLQDIDKQLEEAARVDGANRRQTITRVVLPLMRPTFGLVITLQVISTMRIFTQVLVMTDGGPGAGSSTSVIHYLYSFGLTRGRLAFASSISLMLFGFILVVTVVHRRFIKETF